MERCYNQAIQTRQKPARGKKMTGFKVEVFCGGWVLVGFFSAKDAEKEIAGMRQAGYKTRKTVCNL